MTNLSIFSRMVGAFGVMLLLLGAVAAMGVMSNHGLSEAHATSPGGGTPC